jgi:glycosyltransferase involved in cell wall biosynthesis
LTAVSGCTIEPKLLSIIIPTFNGASRIGRCLEALLQQKTFRKMEILVVDDGSTDDTAAAIGRYLGVRLIAQANAGPAAARNRGAAEARGDIILFTDDDCVPMPTWLDAREPTAPTKTVSRLASCRSSTRTDIG